MKATKHTVATQDSDFSFDVAKIRLHKPDGTPTDVFGVENLNTGRVYRGCTDQYGIVKHDAVVSLMREAIAKRNMPFQERIVLLDDGAQMVARYTFPLMEKHVASVNDKLSFRFDARNSYNLTWTAHGCGGAERLVCKNGLVSFQKEIEFSRKHTTAVTLDGVSEALDKAIVAFENDVESFNNLARVSIDSNMGLNVLKHLVEKRVISKRVRENIEPLWLNPSRVPDQDRNLWTLYNAITEYLTHTVETERFAMVQRVNPRVASEFYAMQRYRDTRDWYVSALN